MSEFWFVLIFILVQLTQVHCNECPEACACSGTTVDCYDRNLLKIPENIPQDTTRLDIRVSNNHELDIGVSIYLSDKKKSFKLN